MDDKLIRHLARLAHLKLDDDGRRQASADLERIITMIDRMRSIPTDDVEPLAHPLDAVQRLRPDEITETVDRELFQAAAPATADGLYLVPRVLD